MKKAFDKILERLDKKIFKAELHDFGWEGQTANNLLFLGDIFDIINEVSDECKDKYVSMGVYKQVAWERDIAIKQLHELGYEFGQKIENGWIPCNEGMPKAKEKIIEEFAVKLCNELPKYADEITMEDCIIYDVLTVDGVLDIVIQTAERMKNGEIDM